jgi:ketosteroid isomerase-like protein
MSQENVDLVRSILADWERGDWNSTEWAHPEIEFVLADGPTPGSWTGVTEMAQVWGDFLSTWEDPRLKAEEFRELDDERVLLLFHRWGRGRMSGLELGQFEAQGATLFHACDGKVTRAVVYFDRDRALADLGLEE